VLVQTVLSWQARLIMSPGALVWNWLAVHTVSGVQTRLLYDVGAVVSYCLA
jgi:hypothetical protein